MFREHIRSYLRLMKLHCSAFREFKLEVGALHARMIAHCFLEYSYKVSDEHRFILQLLAMEINFKRSPSILSYRV